MRVSFAYLCLEHRRSDGRRCDELDLEHADVVSTDAEPRITARHCLVDDGKRDFHAQRRVCFVVMQHAQAVIDSIGCGAAEFSDSSIDISAATRELITARKW